MRRFLKNHAAFIGHLGRDPEFQYTPNGVPLAKLSVAVNERVKQGDEYVEETTWVDLTAWGAAAERANTILSKGSLVYFEARYQKRKYEVDGQTRTAHEFVVTDFEPLSNFGRKELADEEEFSGAEIPF